MDRSRFSAPDSSGRNLVCLGAETEARVAEFAHLHLHTEYSLLDGMGRIGEYIRAAKAKGIQHLAVTDHGVMYAAYDWHKELSKAGLHPIVGMEAYLAEGSARAKERKSYHLLLLAENETGYRNLLKLASYASLEGYYYRPRIDLDALSRHSAGLIGTSACLGGPVANNFLHGQPDAARDYAGKLAEIFGPDRFYIEIQDHGIDDQVTTNRELIPLAKSLGLPLVATNDVHYCDQGDAPAQEILVCVQTNTTLNDTKRLKSESDQLFLKGPEEMERVFGSVPEALQNTIKIAEMCTLDLGFKGYHMPEFDVPAGHSPQTYLEQICREGLKRKYGHDDGAVGERLAYELGVINEMGFTNYFLVVWDFVRFAKENRILVGPGRGSAAASIVTYALDVTALDPLEYDLIFERFLNPSRISMPDIDIDFADDRRAEVIDYVVRKYGDDRVAQIVTFGTLAAKASVRDVGRAMGWSFGETDRIAKLIPVGPGITIEGALEKVPELRQLYESDKAARELIDTAQKVEGVARHSSTHAAGVVISRDPLVEHVPLQRAGGKSEGEVTTQYPMGHLESIGLLKMDFLGLKTLTHLGKAVELARRSGHDISLESIPLDDEKAYDLLCRGETAGIFQLEGGMTTRMTIDVQPRCFEDLIALMALIRPGPMEMAPAYIEGKRDPAKIDYIHPVLEQKLKPILAETYGVALYQEQVMRMANVLANFSMAEGDGLRKAMGKKLPEEMAKYYDRFVTGCLESLDVEKSACKVLAQKIWDLIERFAGYGFNKAHSAAYAVIAAQTAYLKANFPVEFMAALLSIDIGNTDKIVFDVVECRRAGIQVLPPDVNRSDWEFGVEEAEPERLAVRFGLGAVKNAGEGAIRCILAARADQPDGRFVSLEAFCDAVDWSTVNRRVAECLVKCGAFDGLGGRGALLAALEGSIAAAQRRQKASARGQIGLFELGGGGSAQAVAVTAASGPEPSRKELLAWEKELIGFYLSDHPLSDVVTSGQITGNTLIVELAEREPGDRLKVIGMVAGVRRIVTKTNRTMAIVDLEDLTGNIELVAFPDCFERHAEVLVADQIVEVMAKLERRGEQLQLVCETASTDIRLSRPAVGPRRVVHVRLRTSPDVWTDIRRMQDLDEILRRHEGDDEVMLHVPHRGATKRLRSRSRRVDWNDVLAAELKRLLGPDGVRLEEERLAS
jgi:DNA polymerase-3 subunit alpha